MAELIRVEEHIKNSLYKLYGIGNNILIGSFIADVDGYLYFWEDPGLSGSWAAHTLREIADKLDALNKPWDDHINSYFKEQEELGLLENSTQFEL